MSDVRRQDTPFTRVSDVNRQDTEITAETFQTESSVSDPPDPNNIPGFQNRKNTNFEEIAKDAEQKRQLITSAENEEKPKSGEENCYTNLMTCIVYVSKPFGFLFGFLFWLLLVIPLC